MVDVLFSMRDTRTSEIEDHEAKAPDEKNQMKEGLEIGKEEMSH